MPLKSPFFSRTSVLCASMKWREWAGYHSVVSYLNQHETEYFALRNAAGLLDVTPLFKYRVTGSDSEAFLSRIMVRDIRKLKPGRVFYCCWCTHDGKVVDDGTVMRSDEAEFFVTSADPSFSWFGRFTRGIEVKIEDVTQKVAALALQGPESARILNQITDLDVDSMRYFDQRRGQLGGLSATISRTGYTGDLGFEVWVDYDEALPLWDAIMDAGKFHSLRPVGLDALDMTRIEAGLILKDVDYFNALHALTEDRKSSPYELSLGWMVDLDRGLFNGSAALEQEKASGSTWSFMGLDINWEDLEGLFARHGLPPEIPSHAWRSSVPVYQDPTASTQIGYATSGTWSPILKKNIALATLKLPQGQSGNEVYIEATVEHRHHLVRATVQKPQFFNPKRKTAVKAASVS